MTLDGIIGTILVRDHYRWVRLQYISRILVALFVALVASSIGTVWLASKSTQYRYLLTDASGTLLQMVPLDRPNMTDEQVLTWGTDAITRLYTFDFLNYKRQFQRAQNDITVTGWRWFEDSMIRSGNFGAIRNNQFVTTAHPNGPAQITDRGLLRDPVSGQSRYVWTVEIPITITYQSSERTTSQDIKFRTSIIRVPEFVSKAGVQLRQMIGERG